MRLVWLSLAALAWGAPALAHDFWLQPRSYWPGTDGVTPVSIQVGHGPDRETWGADPSRVVLLRSLSSSGLVDRRAELRGAPQGGDATMRFAGPGAHVLALQTSHAESELPALRFNDFLKEEGLTPAIQLRQKTRTTQKPGREIYSRRAKALVQVGPVTPADTARVLTPLGLSLEIVPERNPYALRPNEPLPVRVLYEGRPLAGALVKLTNLAADAKPLQTRLSDAQGRAAFVVPRSGAWLINVIWTKAIAGDPRGDFDTTFSSLTFGYPPGRATR